MAKNNPNYAEHAEHFVASINSYLGFMIHYSSYKIRYKMIWGMVAPEWWKLVYTYGAVNKLVLKKDYTSNVKYLKKVRHTPPIDHIDEAEPLF